MMGWGYDDGSGWAMVAVMVVGVLLVVGAIIVGVVLFGPRHRLPPRTHDDTVSDAEHALELRFARGEIDADALARGRAALRER